LHVGDCVTAVNGRQLRSQTDYTQAITGVAEGSRVPFRVQRDGRVFTLPVIATYIESVQRMGTSSSSSASSADLQTGATQPVVGMAFVSEEGGGEQRGLLIARVAKDLPARLAGVRKGDLVKMVGGRPTRTQAEYNAALAGRAPGSRVNFLIERSGEDMTFPITLGAHAASLTEHIPTDTAARPTGKPQVGILIAKTQDGVEADGVYISKVKPHGPADMSGIKDGDMLTSIQNQRVRSQADYVRVIGGTRPGDVVAFDLVRYGAAMTIPVTVGGDNQGSAQSFSSQGSVPSGISRTNTTVDGSASAAPRRRHFQYGAKSTSQL